MGTSRRSSNRRGRIKIKPFSINEMYYGKKTMTKAYRFFRKAFLANAPTFTRRVRRDAQLQVTLAFGFSSRASDADNPIKPTLDALQIAVGFDDKPVYKLVVTKEIVKRGYEYIDYEIKTLKKR